MRILLFFLTALATFAATDTPGIRLEQVSYPFPVATYTFQSQNQPLEMAYMDIAPAGTARAVVLLLHGKNFSGSYFGQTAKSLQAAGYRVIIPDQIGFGKSSRPEHYQFTFHQLARNTKELLASLGIQRVHVLGHSMGGMLAARFALLFPDQTASLTLLDPLGLEDWGAAGVPYSTIETNFKQELAKTPESIRADQQKTYYHGEWKDAYQQWVDQLVSVHASPLYPQAAWNQALTADMIFTQPVVHELGRISAPTLFMIGQRDRTAIGRDSAPPATREKLGDYPRLGRAAHAAIKGSELVELEGLGHLPHIEAFDRFFAPYRDFLERQH